MRKRVLRIECAKGAGIGGDGLAIYSFHHCVPGVMVSFVCDDRARAMGRNICVQLAKACWPKLGDRVNGACIGATPAAGWHEWQSAEAAAAASVTVLTPCRCLCLGFRAHMTNSTR